MPLVLPVRLSAPASSKGQRGHAARTRGWRAGGRRSCTLLSWVEYGPTANAGPDVGRRGGGAGSDGRIPDGLPAGAAAADDGWEGGLRAQAAVAGRSGTAV